jgi:hypothetical protein
MRHEKKLTAGRGMHGCMDAWMHGCMDAWMSAGQSDIHIMPIPP